MKWTNGQRFEMEIIVSPFNFAYIERERERERELMNTGLLEFLK